MTDEPDREALRHVLAVIAYRGGKVIRDAPPDFAGYRADPGARTPAQILAHLCDLLDWTLTLLEGAQSWRDSAPGAWERDAERFFRGLARVDERLAAAPPPVGLGRRVFQGPLADALTHIGQLAMLRRMAGVPVRGENYFVADIAVGRLGPGQSAPRREFD
jgi:hypothetical protein